MKCYKLLFFIFLPVLCFSQEDFCAKTVGDGYFPLTIGLKKNLTWGQSKYVLSVEGSVEKNGKTYMDYRQDFGEGTSYDLLLRNQNDTIYMYNEKQKTESILLIAIPKKGLKWENSKIVATDGTFESPFCTYDNLLVIQNKFPNGKKEKRYYKKGLGLVAVTSKKGIKGMFIPNKEETIAMTKPLSFVGCEDEATKDEIKQCTMKKIHRYVVENLQKSNFKMPKKEGILDFKLHVSKTGKVVKVEPLNTIKGGRQIRKRIIEILKSLPVFNPTMSTPKKAVGTKFTINIPLKFK